MYADISALEAFDSWAAAHLYSEISSLSEQKTSLLAFRVLVYLNGNLLRAQAMSDGVAAAIQKHNLLLSCLALRGFLECLGGMSYLLSHLEKHYSNSDSIDPLDLTFRLLAGSRRKNDPSQAINVLTQIDSIDPSVHHHFREALPDNTPLFRHLYDDLSEYCHPNAFGLLFGTRGEISFWDDDEHSPLIDFSKVFSQLALSVQFYQVFHRKVLSLVQANEIMPKTESFKGTR